MKHRVTHRGKPIRPLYSEQGAALVVSLILLLIMTIVGVSAMNGARLEVSMAGLIQQEGVAFRGAERALRAAELYVENNISGAFNAAVDGHYLPEDVDADAAANPAVGDWTDLVSLDDSTVADLSEHDAFVVEYLGVMTLPGSAVNDGGDQSLPEEKVKVYRITTRSDTDGRAVRIIESIYTKPYNPMAP